MLGAERHTYIALLRGINVGKGKRVPMAALRELLSELGYTNVATLLNSGNAVFKAKGGAAASHARAIAKAIQERLSVEVPVVVKLAEELAAIVRENPFSVAAAHHSRLLVAFAPDQQALSGLREIDALVVPPEAFAIGGHAAYLYCATGILESSAGKAILGRLGKSVTTRNWATTLKLNALASGSEA